jgi:hypothetical protein
LRVVPLRSTSRASLYVPPSRSIEGLLTPNQNFSLIYMRDVMHPLVVENRERYAEHSRRDHRPTEQEREDQRRDREIGNEKPDRQEQKVEPIGLGMMIVMQPVLQFPNKSEA